MMSGGIQHPADSPVLQRNLEEYLQQNDFVTSARMRNVVSDLIRESMESSTTGGVASLTQSRSSTRGSPRSLPT